MGISVLAAASVGLLATGVAGAADDSSTQFDNLKPIKAPNPCKNDTGVDDSTIKVGTIIPTSGPFALFYAQALDGIKARVAEANAEGELGKRKIELVNVDDAGDAARNITAAQQLAEQDKVFAHHDREQRRRRQRPVPAQPEDAGRRVAARPPGVRHLPELLRHAERQHQEHQDTSSRRATPT